VTHLKLRQLNSALFRSGKESRTTSRWAELGELASELVDSNSSRLMSGFFPTPPDVAAPRQVVDVALAGIRYCTD
jgi:hypothetical protein